MPDYNVDEAENFSEVEERTSSKIGVTDFRACGLEGELDIINAIENDGERIYRFETDMSFDEYAARQYIRRGKAKYTPINYNVLFELIGKEMGDTGISEMLTHELNAQEIMELVVLPKNKRFKRERKKIRIRNK